MDSHCRSGPGKCTPGSRHALLPSSPASRKPLNQNPVLQHSHSRPHTFWCRPLIAINAGARRGHPWESLSNLTWFSLSRIPGDKITTTLLLDFFMRAPLLRKVWLMRSLPSSSDIPPERVVSLSRLEQFTISGPLPYSTLLDHLSIRPNATMVMTFNLTSDRLPIQDHHPKSGLTNFRHLSHITQISLGLGGTSKLIFQVYGPSGKHCIHGKWVGEHMFQSCPVTVDARMWPCSTLRRYKG